MTNKAESNPIYIFFPIYSRCYTFAVLAFFNLSTWQLCFAKGKDCVKYEEWINEVSQTLDLVCGRITVPRNKKVNAC